MHGNDNHQIQDRGHPWTEKEMGLKTGMEEASGVPAM